MGNRGKPLLASVFVATVLACGKAEEKAASASVEPAPAIATSPEPLASGRTSDCPHTGLWAICSVERRLKQSGFVARKLDEAPKRDGFSVKPLVYSLGRSRLEIFVYEHASDLSRDMAALDTILVVPRGRTTSPWESPPTLIRSGNLAAILLTSSPLQAERLSLALTAGAPQPGSPR